MPSQPLAKCSVPTCRSRRCDSKSKYCLAHQRLAYQQHNLLYPPDKFYGSRKWRNFRDKFIADNPLCIACLARGVVTRATVADHIRPRSEGGADFDLDNIQALCKNCHDRKRGQEAQRAITI